MMKSLQFHKLLRISNQSKIQLLLYHKVSKMFPPLMDHSSLRDESKVTAVHRLMLETGIIANCHPGLFALLPLGVRSIEKLTKIIDFRMKCINAQKIFLPHLTSSKLWEKSGRMQTSGTEVMRLHDRNNHLLILSPTHEESVTDLVSSIKLFNHNQLPLRLYQIGTKFRDELRLKHGLLRAREFLMKDLYTFDKDMESAHFTYEEITKTYCNIFKDIGITVTRAEASSGMIGGSLSHEFHIPSSIGEDSLIQCNNCQYVANSELYSEVSFSTCPKCSETLEPLKGIEIAHTFLLGTKYSFPLAAEVNIDGKSTVLQMGCYGIGVTRLLNASLEVLSCSNKLNWPLELAPFRVCLIPPKRGSKIADSSHWSDDLAFTINKIPGYFDEVVVDDRMKLTIGKRLNDAKKTGYPIIIVIGKASSAEIPQFEVFDNTTQEKFELTQSDLIQHLISLQRKVDLKQNY